MTNAPNYPHPKEVFMTKIAVALSGGVDSSLTVKLCKERGFDVIAITLRVQQEREGQNVCAGDSAIMRAKEVARFLDIEHHVCDVCRDFSDLILQYAWDEYAHGRTPSPCVRCNERIKFGKMLDFARSLGCEYMATGHYARIVPYHGLHRIARGLDAQKDQSYFLSGLDESVTSHILFPLGELTKPQVRTLAAQYNIPSAKTPDSQNVCITTPGMTFAETLCDLFHGHPKIGDFVLHGQKLAKHQGVHHYTIGQRHGLGSLVPTKISFVKNIHDDNIEITTDPAELDTCTLTADQAVWHVEPLPNMSAQIRYRSAPTPCKAEILKNGSVAVTFETPVHAPAPGQVIAFYDGDTVIGRAIIRNTGLNSETDANL